MRVKTTYLKATNDAPARIRVSWRENGLASMVEYPLSSHLSAVQRLFTGIRLDSLHPRGAWWEAKLKSPPPAN